MTTDLDRADAFLSSDLPIDGGRDAVLVELAALIAAVRAEAVARERAAAVAFLRRRVQETIAAPLVPLSANTTAVYVASVTAEADAIERGDHGDGS